MTHQNVHDYVIVTEHSTTSGLVLEPHPSHREEEGSLLGVGDIRIILVAIYRVHLSRYSMLS